ncbi:MAG: polysaccharide pyruvyl transferase family protein [Clostridiales bacterium]|nr:polysaccharide pyruvyl transferase family protein [Clostridiales bacterium]
MKKALMWSVIPLDNRCSRDDMLIENRIGSNSGNLLFHTSMARALTLDESGVPDTCFTEVGRDLAAFADRANATYRAFVMPLANAFRANYIPRLRTLTKLVRALSIPCIVTGVGIQADEAEAAARGFSFDADVHAFVDAVLDKSAMLGVRGHVTAGYLKHLGYVEDRHFTVIGCPSMYSFGPSLPTVDMGELRADAEICYNGKADSAQEIRAFTHGALRRFPNHTYIAQNLDELRMLRAGVPVFPASIRPAPEYIPMTRLHRRVRAGRAVGFLDAGTWIAAMRGMALSFGCNIHGNVAALLAGVPAVVLEKDQRVAEIARYHDIPTVTMAQMRAGVDPMRAFECADFSRFNEGHAERFGRFAAFMDANGLAHIDAAAYADAPYDRALARQTAPGAVRPLAWQSAQERRAARAMASLSAASWRRKAEAKLRRSLGAAIAASRAMVPFPFRLRPAMGKMSLQK